MESFCDESLDFRLSALRVVEDNGGAVCGYNGIYLQVALPSDLESCNRLTAGLTKLGMRGCDRITWFPLGSDNPPDSLRHFGPGTAACPRGDRPGYWKYRNYYVEM